MTQRSRFHLLVALLAVASALALAGGAGAWQAADPPTPVAMEGAIARAFERGDPAKAAELIEEYIRQWPAHPQMLYNLACAYSLTGERDKAASALYKAVQAGFRDFAYMKTDPDLDAIRDHPMYTAILEAAKKTEGERAEDALARWKRTYGTKHYRYEIDEKRHLTFATALDETSHDAMRTMLQRESDQLARTLFGAPPEYYILIAVPTPADAEQIFGGDPTIGGRYEHAARRLVARDIGESLRHEFFHAMHYGDMERRRTRKPHAMWVQEGLAALYEDYELPESGEIRFLPNERDVIVANRARIGRLTKWEDFFHLTGERFMARAGANYPQARVIFEWVAEQGKLADWYHAYADHFAEDATGTKAFELVFDQPLAETEKAWRQWVMARPRMERRIEAGDAALGITADQNASNDGVLIASIVPGSSAARSRLRVGDVIVSVDGRPTRSLRELVQIIVGRNAGDEVEIKARRRKRYFTTTVVLRPLPGGW